MVGIIIITVVIFVLIFMIINFIPLPKNPYIWKKSNPFWRPKKNIVYHDKELSSQLKTNFKHIGVVIRIDKEDYPGTFSVGDNWCEIRTKKINMILPRKNVKFKKEVELWDTIRYYGQQGDRGKEIRYYAIVKKYSIDDINRFKEWKGKQ